MATAASEAESMLAKMALECGADISASQEEILANSSFLGGNNALSDDEEEEVFATPPDATQQQQPEDPVTMCTLPFTPTPPKSAAPPSAADAQQQQEDEPITMRNLPFTPTPSKSPDEDDSPLTKPRRKPRVCIRKVRGARISTPTPSPEQQQQPEPPRVDPLLRAVLMIPTRTTTAATSSSTTQDAVKDFLALARQKDIF